MNSQSGFTLFIPIYNEETLLVPNTVRLIETLDPLMTPYEIIIGSNGSTDGSIQQAGELCARYENLRFFHLPQKGVGAAFREGVKRAVFERIITVDMDLSIDLEFIEKAHRLLSRYEVVIGSKVSGSQKRSWTRRMASSSFIRIARLLLRIDFHDYSIAAKGYRRELLEKYLPCIDDKTFYVVSILYLAHHDGRSITEIPVKCHDMRESRFNLVHEGFYKFGNLFRLWLVSLGKRQPVV